MSSTAVIAGRSPLITPAALNRVELSIYLRRSLPALDRDLIAGRVPAGFRIGRSRRWLKADIDAWMAAGAPPAAEWETIKQAKTAAAR